MKTHSKESRPYIWKNFVELVYCALLSLYPKCFRDRFGVEMKLLFNEALHENREFGFLQTFRFLSRELIEAPISILDQHLIERPKWLRPYPMNLFIFSIGFLFIGFLESGENMDNGGLASIIVFLLVGGLGGLAVGINFDTSRKKQFFLCGAIGFLCAKTFITYFFFRTFPNAFVSPGDGFNFLIPFFYPTLIGSVYGLFLGIATSRWRSLLKFMVYTSGAFFAGFFVNRFFSALMQSYVLRSPTQSISQTGTVGLLLFIMIPYLLQGIMLGLAFGRISQRRVPINAS